MKASVLFGAGWENDFVEVLWRDAGRVFCRLSQHNDNGQTHAFVPIPAAAEHPTPESIDRLEHEHELRSYLDDAWALRPLELVRERGQTLLVVDYKGGEPLDRLVGEPIEVGQFLRIAVALSGAIGQLHGRGLIHKDIKPANVLVDLETGRVRLMGLGIASRLPCERQPLEPPEVIADLFEELKRHGWDIPLIVITAQRDKKVRSQVLKRGAITCLFKPFSSTALRAALGDAFAVR